MDRFFVLDNVIKPTLYISIGSNANNQPLSNNERIMMALVVTTDADYCTPNK